VAALVLLLSAPVVGAEEIEKKFRIGVSIGSAMTTDQEHSPSANIRQLYNENGVISDFLYDPRNDGAAFSNFGVESALGLQLSASYAFTRNWYVEASAGYQQAGIGNVEVQAWFDGVSAPPLESFGFRIANLDGGTLTQVPIQFTAGYRFRPKATFNPYVCAGIGYLMNSYQPSDEINQLSRNLNNSIGGFVQLVGTGLGGEVFLPVSELESLSGISVDAPDAPEYHFGGGFELTFKSKWAVFVDARYTVYSGSFHMTVNGADQLGVSVPADQAVITSPGALGPFGAYSIPTGGLIDGGSWVLAGTSDPCDPGTANCGFTGPLDGVADPGIYYVHAGDVRFDALTIQVGVKFTF
jgi:outer membrane protein W